MFYISIIIITLLVIFFIGLSKIKKNILIIYKDENKLIYSISDEEYLTVEIKPNKDIYQQIKQTLSNRKDDLKNSIDNVIVSFNNDAKINLELLNILKK